MAIGTTQRDIYVDQRGRKYKRMTHEQRVEVRKSYVANIPRWRRPVVGYFICLPIVALFTYGLYDVTTMLAGKFFSPDTIMVLPVLFLALFWGVGPALLAIVAGAIALDYLFVNAGDPLSLQSWHSLIQLLPFIISGLFIAVIIAQRERARLNALATEWELQVYARYLEDVNQKLEDANQTKDRFLSIASHELKTPITTIRGQAQIVLRNIARQKEQAPELASISNSLEKINAQTGRLTLLIDELLDVSSIRAGKLELRKKKYDLRELCREVVNDLHMMTGRMIDFHAPTKAVNVSVDSDRISQVMVNLLNNAIKYSPENSPVEVFVEEQDDDDVVLVTIRDHGKGIEQSQLERIFDTFYRTPDAETSTKRGLGLGLAISKEIVERHEGRIWCESMPGQGSCFFVELPLK